MSTQPTTPSGPDQTGPETSGSHMPHYQQGRAWAQQLLNAADAQRHQTTQAICQHLTSAGQLTWSLGDLDNPNDLRDFIAGANRQFEATLEPDHHLHD